MQWIDDIDTYIGNVLGMPGSHQAMFERTRSFNSALTDSEMVPLVDQLELFVRGTPDLIRTAATEAEQLGVLDQLQPLFQKSLDYFLEHDDVIPDHLGLYGLLDDAYLAQKLLLRASERHEEQTGSPLFGEHLRPALDVIAHWIGAEQTEMLDAIAERDVKGFDLKSALVVGARGAVALGMIGSALSSNDGGGSWGNSFEADTSRRMATMGMPTPNWY